MRTLAALGLILMACGGGDPAADPDAAVAAPDAMVDAIPPRDVGYSPPDGWTPPSTDGGLAATGLFAVSRDDAYLRQFDLNTGAIFGAVEMTVAGGGQVIGANGLAAHPTDGTLFVLLKRPGSGGRVLASVDPLTGALTVRGNTNDRFAGLAFDGAGTLYGITGRGASTPSAVFRIDPDTAATTLVQQLGIGDDGESIAWSSGVGFMYHASGMTDAHLEAIDLDTVTLDLPYDGDEPGEILAFTWMPSLNAFLAAAQNGSGEVTLWTITALAETAAVGITLDFHLKGLALVEASGTP